MFEDIGFHEFIEPNGDTQSHEKASQEKVGQRDGMFWAPHIFLNRCLDYIDDDDIGCAVA